MLVKAWSEVNSAAHLNLPPAFADYAAPTIRRYLAENTPFLAASK